MAMMFNGPLAGVCLIACSVTAHVQDHDARPVARVGEQDGVVKDRIEPFPGLVVDFKADRIELRCTVKHAPEPLEQIVCTPATRDHETLLTANILPSQLHGALMLLDLTPGSPGRFEMAADDTLRFIPPTGDIIDLAIVVPNDDGTATVHQVESWMHRRGEGDDARMIPFPDRTWVFSGSRMQDNPSWMDAPGRHYVADMTGSLVGLVTFGDEPVGLTTAIHADAGTRQADWRPKRDVMPPDGTVVTLHLTPVRSKAPATRPEGDERRTGQSQSRPRDRPAPATRPDDTAPSPPAASDASSRDRSP